MTKPRPAATRKRPRLTRKKLRAYAAKPASSFLCVEQKAGEGFRSFTLFLLGTKARGLGKRLGSKSPSSARLREASTAQPAPAPHRTGRVSLHRPGWMQRSCALRSARHTLRVPSTCLAAESPPRPSQIPGEDPRRKAVWMLHSYLSLVRNAYSGTLGRNGLPNNTASP